MVTVQKMKQDEKGSETRAYVTYAYRTYTYIPLDVVTSRHVITD